MTNNTQTWAEAHPGWAASYMSRESAEEHASQIGGRCSYVWASGIDTWHVYHVFRA